ncbi:hypothetical protein NUW58_g4822 [Xylaria curta]|uniref:Uncharacterized protein n=1 Tax=Xylaria curta TaxID=42375 RepID=A0ACC1P704_9PEZI|nr:hypothetical protein NUW58_g4822 [Xylaria curta]
MARWSEYDTDEERLPEGMQRIGYDADTQVYTFRDAEGGIWESAPGNRYGQLRRVANDTLPSYSEADDGNPTQPLTYGGPGGSSPRASWRQEMMPLLNWFLLVGLFLLFMICDDATPHKIKAGETCWAIADARSVSLDALLKANEGLNCDRLSVGETICVPTA